MSKNIIHRLCENPIISNLIRNVIEAGMVTVKKNLAEELGDTSKKMVIDLACGTGRFSKLIKGTYVGIDLDKKHIKYAKKKLGSGRKRFLVKDARFTGFPNKYFDYAMLLCFIHHLSDKELDDVLMETKRITKSKIIIIDAVPLKYNPLGKFFYKMDQGKFIRPLGEQIKLVRKRLRIKKVKIFRSGMDLHSLVVCE